MFSDNKQFQTFQKELEQRDVSILWGWSAKRNSSAKYDDVGYALFYGYGFQPSVLSAIIINYGPNDGFGLYLNDPVRTIEGAAANIAKPRE